MGQGHYFLPRDLFRMRRVPRGFILGPVVIIKQVAIVNQLVLLNQP